MSLGWIFVEMCLHISQKLQTLLAKEVITSIAQMWRFSSLFQILYQMSLQPCKPLNPRLEYLE